MGNPNHDPKTGQFSEGPGGGGGEGGRGHWFRDKPGSSSNVRAANAVGKNTGDKTTDHVLKMGAMKEQLRGLKKLSYGKKVPRGI